MVTKNYYELFEISSDATTMEIKTAYRKLVRKYHPDINKSPDATVQFKEITKAYEILSDEDKRKHYNLINGIFEPCENKIPKNDYKKTTEKKEKKFDYKVEDCDEKHNEQKIFQKNVSEKTEKTSFEKMKPFAKTNGWFDVMCAKLKKRQKEHQLFKPQKGDNINTIVEISPEEVVTGSKRVINILTKQTCQSCHGHRFINGGKCEKCNGTGIISKKKRITVTIPKGIKDGTKLRIKGEGASGKNGGANGDVYITVRLETKTKLHFDKLNLYYNVPITPYEAALGEEIKVPTFDGVIKVKLPPNTCSGQKFRIANQGIKKNGKIGDLILTVSIEFSSNLSDDEIKLYEKLKNLSKDDIRKNIINE